VGKIQLRPHHIFCDTFFPRGDFQRGGDFDRVMHALRELSDSESDTTIEVVEGVDELCRVCPDCKNNRCESPYGSEDAVRKWDGKILKGLEISYGEARTIKEFHALIRQKAPLAFCRTRCPWREVCSVFGLA